jgi:hypothetical protein
MLTRRRQRVALRTITHSAIQPRMPTQSTENGFAFGSLLSPSLPLVAIVAIVSTAACSSSVEGADTPASRGLFDVPSQTTTTTSSSLYGVWESEGFGNTVMTRLELRADHVRRTARCGNDTYVDVTARARVSGDRIELLEDAFDNVRYSDSSGDQQCSTLLPVASLTPCKTAPTTTSASCFLQSERSLTLALPDAKQRASELNVWKKVND